MSEAFPSFPVIEGVEFRHCLNAIGYAASSDGRVWCCRKSGGHGGYRVEWWPLKPQRHSAGYLQVGIGRANLRLLHCVILEAFVGPAPNGMEACHFPDKDKTNCQIKNLIWGTRTTNLLHRKDQDQSNAGTKHWNAKLTRSQVLEIADLADRGELTHGEIAKKFKICRRNVGRIKSGELWSDVTRRTRCGD